MDKNRKRLQIASLIILVITLFILVRNIVDVSIHGFAATTIPEDLKDIGITLEALTVVNIIIFVISLLILIPDAYVGIKGLQIVKTKTEKKSHITLAKLFVVLYGITVISTCMSFASTTNLPLTIVSLIIELITTLAFLFYAIYAKKVGLEDNKELFEKK